MWRSSSTEDFEAESDSAAAMISEERNLYDMSEVCDFENLFSDSVADPVLTSGAGCMPMSLPVSGSELHNRPASVSSSSWQASNASPLGFFDSENDSDLMKSQGQLASPASSMASNDVPFSPLSERAEGMFWDSKLPTFVTPDPEVLELLQQVEAAHPKSSSLTSASDGEPPRKRGKQWQMGVKSYPLHDDQEQPVLASSKPAIIQSSPAALESTGGPSSGQSSPLSSSCQQVRVRQDNTKTVELSKRGVKRKTKIVEEEEFKDSGGSKTSRNEKNAIAARENRLKKKKEMEDLKSSSADLERENSRLRKTNSEQLQKIGSLEEELEYYKCLMHNDSALAGFLKSMNPTPKVKLSSSVGMSGSKVASSGNSGKESRMSGGVCLHVNGRDASFEFCPRCALQAKATFDTK